MAEQQQQTATIVFDNLHKNVFKAIKKVENKNAETLIISSCPSIDSATKLLSNNDFIKIINETLKSLVAIRFQVTQTFDSSKSLTLNEMCQKNQLLIIFESVNDDIKNKNLHWTNLKSFNISHFQLNYSTAMNEFIIDFTMDSFKQNLDVSIKNLSQYVLTTFNNSQNLNLLMRASATNNQEILKKLLKLPFDINQKTNLGLTAADLALERQHFDILCLLLKNNSTFPKEFEKKSEVKSHKEIKRIVTRAKKLRVAIESDDKAEIEEILDENPNFVYFYDTSNQSAATKAVNEGRIKIYELLLKKGRCIGPCEDVEDILSHISENQKRSFRELHKGLTKESEDHITTILSRCVVSHDDQNVSQRQLLIFELLKNINELSFTKADGSKVPFGNYLLRLITAYGNFKIFFDFNRESVQHMDPTESKATNGTFYFDGSIYVAAKELLNEETRHEAVGAITHELSHFANQITLYNSAKPYASEDGVKKEEFRVIIALYKNMKHDEDIVGWVFENYREDLCPAELIVRAPHIMGHYHKNPQKLSQLRKTYEKLFEYFEEFFTPKLKETLETLERLAKNDSTLTFDQLTEPQKNKIMQIEVEFQGENIELDEIVKKSAEVEVLNQIKPSEMLKMINKTKKEIKIGKIAKIEKEEQEIYIERDFIDFDSLTQKPFEKMVSESSTTQLMLLSTYQLILLSDEAGAGKSTSFKHLCIKLKKIFPNKWISYVDLKKYFKVYEKYSENQEITVTEVLREIIEIENDFDFVIFKHLFGLNQVILLLDGVDEIAPNFKNFFLKLVLEIKNCSENQIWIATRPHHVHQLKDKLKVERAFKLKPWNLNQQKKFIENILRIKNIKENHEEMAEKVYESLGNVLNIKNLSNPFMLLMITESYLIDGKIDESNLFLVYQKVIESKKKVLNKEKGEVANADRDNEGMNIWEVHQVFALKTIFMSGKFKLKKLGKISLKDFSIMKKWENEKPKWSPEKISRYGFLYVDNWDYKYESCKFIHRTVAEFFVAKYLVDNFYEFGDQELSSEEAERRFVMIWKIAVDEYEIVYNFIQSYLESEESFKKLNKNILKLVKNNWIQEYFKSFTFFDSYRVLKCFWRHPGALKILILPKNGEESFFQYCFLKKYYDGIYADAIYYFTNLLEKCFGENWPDFTGYRKINENDIFQHLTQKELESYPNSSNFFKETYQKNLLKLLNFIPQMQIPKEHLKEFLIKHMKNIGRSCAENFLNSDIYKKFKKHFKSYYMNSEQDLLQLIRDKPFLGDNLVFDIEVIKFLDDFLSPEFNFSEEYFFNILNHKYNPLVASIFDNNHDVVEFCKTKFGSEKFQEILTENFFTAIFCIANLLFLFESKDLKLLEQVLSEFFPSDMNESKKIILHRMLTKQNLIQDDKKEEQKAFGLSIMDYLPNEIKILEDKKDKNFEDENKLNYLQKLQKILIEMFKLHCIDLSSIE